MPSDTRALTRQARDRARRTGETYTAARETVLNILQLMDETGETYAEVEAWVDDPRNHVLCTVCGWTNGMACPECAKGCGCETRCTGWRHVEYATPEERQESGCPECGAGGGDNPYGECVCWEE